MKKYYCWLIRKEVNISGYPSGIWLCKRANSKKEIVEAYNIKAYEMRVEDVLTEKQAIKKAETDIGLSNFIASEMLCDLMCN